ncbi:MAG: tRNA pseudouridine(55) synthase TruB [Austwickia sp.]|nr:tRNA pseudouridine(55) synthase TruB [Austwickia sp.]
MWRTSRNCWPRPSGGTPNWRPWRPAPDTPATPTPTGGPRNPTRWRRPCPHPCRVRTVPTRPALRRSPTGTPEVPGAVAAGSGDGILVVDKPSGMTSHDVVARVRRLVGTRRVGHAGTLDPMATGVLVLGVNRGTRLLSYLVGADKEYHAIVRLGAATTTDDADGEWLPVTDPAATEAALAVLTAGGRPAIVAATAALTGPIEQVPSAVSAIKVAGVRSYARVRAGQEVELPARAVTVHRFEVGEPASATAHARRVVDVPIEVVVSSGTYVRALARDLGAALGVGGHLIALRRRRVGAFGLECAHRLDDLAERAGLAGAGGSGGADSRPVPLLALGEAAALVLPTRVLDAGEAGELRHGRSIAADPQRRGGPVAGLGQGGELIAVLTEDGEAARPRAVFAPAAPGRADTEAGNPLGVLESS